MTVVSDPDGRLNTLAQSVGRRYFLASCVRTATGLFVLTGIQSCGGGGENVAPPPGKGNVDGAVTDLQGNPVPSLGRIILMFGSGKQVGVSANPDSSGRFKFEGLLPGEYQIRYDAPGQAFVPEPFPHPLRFTVDAGRTTQLQVRVRVGLYNVNTMEIYCGDGFFQLQPDGPENGEAVVPAGINVCWYNVGLSVHSVTGGPWVDSGDLQKTQAYLWTANQKGFYAYRCKYHAPQMQATLRVA